MASIADQLTTLYVFVDDYLKTHPRQAAWRRSPNHQPRFTDAEVLTLGLMQGCLGVATLKQTYRLIANNFRDAFPQLCSYPQWLARLHSLTSLVGQLIPAALAVRGLPGHRLYLLDGKPIPVCKPIRHGRVRLLREDGAYFGKSSTGWFFGFKLHALVHQSGAILGAVLTPANWNEREVALALAWSVDGGIALADLGYRSEPLGELLAEEADLLLITPADARDRRALISSLRERVETTFSQLCNRFADRVRSRSWEGLWNTLKLQMLHYNLCHVGLLRT
jgi:IS5 family transposase